MQLQLSERQRSTVAAAVTILATCVILVAIAALFFLVGAFLKRFSGVFLPLAVAGVAALVFKPFFCWFRTRLRLPPSLALVAVFLSAVIPLVAFSWFFGAVLVDQVSDIVQKFPEWWASIEAQVREKAPQVMEFLKRYSIVSRLEGAVEDQQGVLMQGLQALGSSALSAGVSALSRVGMLLGWVVLPVYFSFFLLANETRLTEIDKFLPFFKSDTRKDIVYLVTEFINIVVAFFRGQLIIAFLQGMLFALGFTIVGLKYGFIIGLTLGFLNIIPYLGSIIGLGTALPLALFQTDGGWVKVAAVLIVFTIVQMIEGYLLTPRIMGDRTGLHPMVIIVAIFFWGSALGGIMGMILAIPLTAFLVVFWRLARERYVTELV
ncbi:MAG: AI-2E family transporter [bacterium]|nr:AI-2E family transporter [bacterium]